MLTLPPNIKILLRTTPTDMRLSFNGLSALVKNEFHQDPQNGNLFVFMNKRRNSMKILLWDDGGFWLLNKRLEKGQFTKPQINHDNDAIISRANLLCIIDGYNLLENSRKIRYNPL